MRNFSQSRGLERSGANYERSRSVVHSHWRTVVRALTCESSNLKTQSLEMTRPVVPNIISDVDEAERPRKLSTTGMFLCAASAAMVRPK